jgi:hypothetical protein
MGFKYSGPGCCNCNPSGSITVIGGTIPNCFCTDIPPALGMTSTNPNANFRMFQSCQIEYRDTPGWATVMHLGSKIFISTTAFPDPQADGAEFYYYLTCQLNLFVLTRIYPESPFGSPYRDGPLYSWLVGGYGNTCNPFVLGNGYPYPGSEPVKVTMAG